MKANIKLTIIALLNSTFAFSQADWNTTGNNITAGEFLGSDNSSTVSLKLRTGSYTGNDILFQTNGANTRMTILGTNGNVGIGSANPTQLLDVNGNLTISSNQWYGINNARILSNPGTNNIYGGINAYSTSSTGSRNTHLGYNAGNGVSGAADDNTFVGNNSGLRVTSSDFNTFVGSEAGNNVSTGHSNTLIGYNSGTAITNALSNVMIGRNAGLSVNASLNTFVGAYATASSNFQKSGAIGANSYVEDEKCIVIGAVNGKNSADWTTNVGIGTTAPKQRLHLSTPSSSGTFAQFTNQTTGESSSNGFKIGLASTSDVELRMFAGTRHMQFFTNNFERMRIEDQGNVGIGATTATQKLHVEGTARITGSSGTATRITGRDADGDISDIVVGSGLSFDPATGTLTNSGVGASAWLLTGNSIGSADFIGTTNNFDFIVKTNNSESMRVTAGGNVGINTSAPATKLHVENSTLKTSGYFNNTSNFNDKLGLIGRSINNPRPIGVYGYARTDYSGVESFVYGVKGQASGYGETVINAGVFGISDTTGAGHTNNFGIYGIGENGDNVCGGNFLALNSTNGKGVSAIASGNSVQNIGVYGKAISLNGSVAYGIMGEASGSGTTFPGYFTGTIYVNGTTYPSDSILKENVNDLGSCLEIIGQLRPKTYNYRFNDFPQLNLPHGLNFGLLAQNLENVLPELVQDIVHPAKFDSIGNEISPSILFKGINYNSLIPFLLGGIQEQQAQISNLQQQITNQTPTDLVPLQNQVQLLQNQLNLFQEQLSQCCQTTQPNLDPVFRIENPTATAIEQAMLLQNAPNPFNQNTSIGFYLPDGASDALIKILSSTGQELRVYHLAGVGYGKININGGNLAAGNYFYTLQLSGSVIDTKTMILTK
jgi:hypothetical protein